LTGGPTGKSGRRSTALPLRPGARQRVEPVRQIHGFSADFGISEVALDGEVETALLIRSSHPERGALRNVINAGRGAVDADGAFDESA
jgi:hypothetical protein